MVLNLLLDFRFNSRDHNSAGVVKVYHWDDYTWTKVGFDISGVNRHDLLGSSLAFISSGNAHTLAIGVPSRFNTGHIICFTLDGSSLYERYSESKINGFVYGERFGSSIAISEDGLIAAIGAPGADNTVGNVHTFKIDPEKCF